MKPVLALLSFILLPLNSFAIFDQEFVITPTMISTQIDSVPFDLDHIGEEVLEQESSSTLNELLSQRAGIVTVADGTNGHKSALFLQGGKSGDLLVLIDGIKINDPSSPSGSFDLSLVDLSNIQSVEILKGPQSGLYGADAFSGVVNIITKNEKKTMSQVTLNGGAHNSHGVSAMHNQHGKNTSYRIHTSFQKADGFSIVSGTDEEDGHEYKTAQLKITHKKNSQNINMQVEYLKKRIDLDAWGQDDPNYTETSENVRTQIKISDLFFNSLYNPQLSYSFSKGLRQTINLADDVSAVSSNDLYKSERQEVLQTNTLHWSDSNKTLIGLSYMNERMEASSVGDKELDRLGVFLQQSNRILNLDSTMNVRYDNNSDNDFLTYRIGLSTQRKGFAIQTAYSIATKNPTLYQLYSSYGDPDLKEERQKGGNVSLSYKWTLGDIKWNLFHYELDNLIDYHPITFKSLNAGKATRKGYELSLSQSLGSFRLGVNYTYLIATDEDGEYLVRRPRHQAALNTAYKVDAYNINFVTTYIGQRDAVSGGYMPSFVRLDLKSSYKLSPRAMLSVQWNNLLNHQYEMAEGYQTEGSSLYAKMRYSF